MLSFRVDDFPYTKPDERWRHNLHSFAKFDEVMRKHGAEYVLGVIPTKLEPADVEVLKNLPHVDLALHGIKHDERFANEFRDWQTPQDIFNSLRSAKCFLDTIAGPIDTYIPPHNVVDMRTVDALVAVGFKKLWGGPGSDFDILNYAVSRGLETALHMPPFYGRSDEMLAGQLPAWVRKNGMQTISLHWTWEVNIGLDNLDRLLTELSVAEDS